MACRILALCLSLIPTLLVAAEPAAESDWPQWRGPNRDAISKATGLLKEWPEAGPEVAWKRDDVGIGYSSMAVARGRLFTLGDIDGVEHLICLDVADGSIVWKVQPEPVRAALEARVEKEFVNFDKDGDGQLSEIEALKGIGWNFNDSDRQAPGDPQAIAEVRAKQLLADLDADGDGKLALAEALPAMWDRFNKIDPEDKNADSLELAAKRAEEFVGKLDEDLDGKLSKDEVKQTPLQNWFGRVDAKDPNTNKGDDQLTGEEIKTFLFKSEPGRDGLVTLGELTKFYVANHAGRDGILTQAELRSVYGGYRNGYGDGPRGTPAVDGDRVYAEGGSGDLACYDFNSGTTIWHKNLVSDFGGGRPGWGYCESPLVHENMLIVTPGGGQGTLVALNKETGETLWRTADVKQGAHYSSPQFAEIAGVKQFVQFAQQSLFAVTLDGKPLWSYSKANNGTANIATPLIHGEHVFASSGYGTGGGLVKISQDGDGLKADEVYFEKRMANHHGGMVRVGDHIYGFGNGGLICMNFLTGELAWSNRSVNKGSLIYADGMLYCLGESQEMALVEANPAEYVEHGRFTIPNLGRNSWAHPVVAGTRLYLRNLQQLTAYNIGKK